MKEYFNEQPIVVHSVFITVEYGKWHSPEVHTFALLIENPVDVDEVNTKRDNMIEQINKRFWDIRSINVEYT